MRIAGYVGEMTVDLKFDHIHLISRDAKAAARWYEDMLAGEILASYELRDALQVNIRVGGAVLIIRDTRPGESPVETRPMQDFVGYSSHDEWGTDHFGYTYYGDLDALAEELTDKGATFTVAPWEFNPGTRLCYLSAPDGVSIEIVEGRK